MKISEILLRMFVPRKCLICNEVISYDENLPFCENCIELWENTKKEKCHRCGYEAEYCVCKPSAFKLFPNCLVTYSVFYNSSGKRDASNIAYILKRRGVREIVDFMTENMKKSIIKLFESNGIDIKEYIIAYIPRRKSGIKKYGFDHGLLLAKSLSKKLNINYENVFLNCGKKEQKNLSKPERLKNAKESYILSDDVIVENKNYLLIDDVMTSGATLSSCAKILYTNGAKNVIFATYAKDNFLYGGKKYVKRNTGSYFTTTT